MAFRLIGQNSALRGKFGGTQDGTPNWDVSTTDLKAHARRIRVNDTADGEELSGLADARKITQVKRAGTKFELEVFVGDAGRQFEGKIGHYFQFEYKPLGSLASYTGPIIGVIMDVDWDAPDGAQIERIQVDCDANGGSA
jgi:hypothetical protein